MGAPRRVLLVSKTATAIPALHRLAADEGLQVVRATDPGSALLRLKSGVFECALLDVDTLDEDPQECLSRLLEAEPQLETLTFTRAARLDPGAAPPLTRERLSAALASNKRLDPNRQEAAPVQPDATAAELQKRVAQLTTLYKIGRAISESRNWSEALDYFLTSLKDYLDLQGAAILLYSREATVLQARTVLGIASDDVHACTRELLRSPMKRNPNTDIHALECHRRSQGVQCTGHAHPWRFTVMPLTYRRQPLGFLLLEKSEWLPRQFSSDEFFLKTVQTILAEEVANAVHLSNLVDLKNFNESVLDSVQSGVLTVRQTGEVNYVNKLGGEILGLAVPLCDSEPQRFEKVFRAQGVRDPLKLLDDLFASEDPSSYFETTLLRLDQRSVPLRVRSRRITNPSDSQQILILTFEDLTANKILEEQVRRTDRLRSLGELSSAIAHEVRNPLQGISLTLSNLQEHLREGGRPYVDVMFSEIQRLNGLVSEILSFTRPPRPNPTEVSLRELSKKIVALAADRAERRDVHLDLLAQMEDDLCEVDENQFVQVLLNILLNAIDASSAGSTVQIRLSEARQALIPMQPTPSTVRYCRVEIEDHGTGIKEDEIEKLFDPFFTTKAEGTGLGLCISQRIISEHRGSIHVSSQLGRGSVFRVEFPRQFLGDLGDSGGISVVHESRGAG